MWRIVSLLAIITLEIQARSLTPHAGSPEQLPSEMYELLARCSDFCKNASRHCLSPPRRCGACLTDYVERDGLCFHRFKPADEVETWEQAIRLAKLGLDESAENRVNSRPVVDNENEFNKENSLAVGENNDSPENEEDITEDEAEGEQEVDADTKVISDDGQDVANENKRTDSEQIVKSHEDKTIFKDEIQIHELPTPAAMVQFAAKRDNSVNPLSEFYTLAIVVSCAVVSVFVLVGAGLCYYRYHQNAKAASVVEYPAFGPGAAGTPREQRAGSGDRKLAQSAQMYHYQHQKQQMIAAEKASDELNKDEESEEEENEEGDYTVYECPGLAPTGEMEVKNPLFSDDSTAITSGNGDSPKKD